MIVRIKLRLGPRFSAQRNLDSKLALVMAGFLTPAALLCIVMGMWRLLRDLNVTEEFMFSGGLLSHWQVWLVMGTGLQGGSVYLNRYGRRITERQL